LPITKGWATLEEIERHWSIIDLFECLEAIDVLADIEEAESKAARQEAKARGRRR
jgi:hypothetical protein